MAMKLALVSVPLDGDVEADAAAAEAPLALADLDVSAAADVAEPPLDVFVADACVVALEEDPESLSLGPVYDPSK